MIDVPPDMKKIRKIALELSDAYRSAENTKYLSSSSFGQYKLGLRPSHQDLPESEIFFFGWLVGKYSQYTHFTSPSSIYTFQSFSTLAKTLKDTHCWLELADNYSKDDWKARCSVRMSAQKFDTWMETIKPETNTPKCRAQKDRGYLLIWLNLCPSYWDINSNKQVENYDRFLQLVSFINDNSNGKYHIDPIPSEEDFKFWAQSAKFRLWKEVNKKGGQKDDPNDVLRWLDTVKDDEFDSYDSFRGFIGYLDKNIPVPTEDDFSAHSTVDMSRDEFFGWIKKEGYSKKDKSSLLLKWIISADNNRAPTYSRMKALALAINLVRVPTMREYTETIDIRDNSRLDYDEYYWRNAY